MMTFTIWNPYVPTNQDHCVKCVVMNAEIMSGIGLENEFAAGILADIGIEAKIVHWLPTPYRSNYYTDYLDLDDWRDTWTIVWQAKITTDRPITSLTQNDLMSWIPTDTTVHQWLPSPKDDEAIACLAVSDFDSELSRQQAEKAIISFAELNAPELRTKPRFYKQMILKKYYQLQIDLGLFPSAFYQSGADYAQQILNLCKEAGGTVHNEDRSF